MSDPDIFPIQAAPRMGAAAASNPGSPGSGIGTATGRLSPAASRPSTESSPRTAEGTAELLGKLGTEPTVTNARPNQLHRDVPWWRHVYHKLPLI